MMKPNVFVFGSALLCGLTTLENHALAQATAFTYQGSLNSAGSPAQGSYDFNCSLYDAATGGAQQGLVVTTTAVAVSKGAFSVQLDFGNQFNGSPRWLEVAVRTNGPGPFTTLSPRQALLPVPQAIYSGNAGVAGTALSASSVPASAIPAGSITADKLAAGAVGTPQLATGAVSAPQVVLATIQATVPNTSYTAAGAAPTAFQLPASANVGDVVQLAASGPGGWSAQNYNPEVWTARDSARQWTAVASSADGTKLIAAVDGGQLYTSADSGATWTAQASAKVWSAVASSADGTTLAATAAIEDPFHWGAGGPHISTDSGMTWAPRDRNLDPNVLMNLHWNGVASSTNGTKLVAVAGAQPLSVTPGALHTSTDSGTSWTVRDGSRAWQAVASSADGTKLVAAATGGQLYTSTDSGATWTARAATTNWYSVASSADGTRLVAAVNGGQLYTSTDSGVTWTAQTVAPALNWQSVASSADGTRLAAAAWGGPLYTSSDSGVTWTARESNRQWSSVAMSADGVTLVAAVYKGQLYTSGFETWGAPGVAATLQYRGRGQWLPTLAPPGTVGTAQLALGAVGSAQLATRAVGSAQLAPGAVGNAQLAAGAVGSAQLAPGAVSAPMAVSGSVQAALPNTSYAATGTDPMTFNLPSTANVGDVVQISGVGPGGWHVPYYDLSQWTPRDSVRNWYAVASSADGANLVAADHGGHLYTSRDCGTNWTAQAGSPNANWAAVASSADGTKLVAADPGTGSGGHLYTSMDSGVTWTSRYSANYWSAVASSADGTKLLAAEVGLGGTGGRLYTSTDSGTNWIAQAGSPKGAWQGVASSADGTKLVAVAQYGSIYTSTDSGAHWTAQAANLKLIWYAVASSADGTRLVAAADYLYTSSDSGTNWIARGSSPWWSSVASSADGTKVVAGVLNGQLYTSGAGNEFVGGQGQSATFQYTGNGQWSQSGAGGGNNTSSGRWATVGGGQNNVSSGDFATVPGGSGNVAAGKYSFAAGHNATAYYDGSFVWSDSTGSADDLHPGPNSFKIRAVGFRADVEDYDVQARSGISLFVPTTGGVGIDSAGLSVSQDVILGSRNAQLILKDSGEVDIFNCTLCGTSGVGVKLDYLATSWSTISDRNVKKNVVPVDYQAVLDKLAKVPIEQWNYSWEEDSTVPNIGPMAQEFKAAFYPGRNDKGISTLEFDGVELAAIQGLNQKVEEQAAQLRAKEARIQSLEERLATLEALLKSGQSR